MTRAETEVEVLILEAIEGASLEHLREMLPSLEGVTRDAREIIEPIRRKISELEGAEA